MDKVYRVKVACEYYVDVKASSQGEARHNAIYADYCLSDLNNFEYVVEEILDVSEDEIDMYDITGERGYDEYDKEYEDDSDDIWEAKE